MKRIRAVCIATLADGTVIEGRPAQELLSRVMDWGWDGPIGTAPRFAYREMVESDPPEAQADGDQWFVPPR